MNTELIREWAQALDSGDYNQCKGRLIGRTEDGEPSYCAMGVLGKVLGLEDDWIRSHEAHPVMAEALGLKAGRLDDGEAEDPYGEFYLEVYSRNDGLDHEPMTFPEIAVWLKETWL